MRFTNWLLKSRVWPFKARPWQRFRGALLYLVGIFVLVFRLSPAPRLESGGALSPPYSGFAPRSPVALAISPDENLYLLDAQLGCVARLTAQGELLSVVGGPGAGPLQFSNPADLSINSGLDLFIADWGNNRIVRLDRWLNYLAEFRSLEGTSQNLTFERPVSAVQGARGDLFLADAGNDRILKIAPQNEPLFSFGAYGEGRGSLSQPRRIELDPRGGIWVLDARNHIVHFDEFGGYVEEIRLSLAGEAAGLAVGDSTLWVCSDSALWAWRRGSDLVMTFSLEQAGLPDSLAIVDVACRNEQLWLLDSGGNLRRFRLLLEP